MRAEIVVQLKEKLIFVFLSIFPRSLGRSRDGDRIATERLVDML